MSDEIRTTAPTAADSFEPKTMKEHMPSRYAPAEVETWLEDKAAEGWHLTKFTSNFLHCAGEFEKGEPARCRYRLTALPKKEREPGEEYRALCEGCGWRYVTTMYHTFHLWRCDDATAPEIEMDPEVQAEGFRYVHRRLIWDVVENLLCLLILILILCFSLLWGDTPPLLKHLERSTVFYPLFYTVLSVGWVGYSVWGLRRVNRLIARLRAGIPLERPAPYRQLQRWTRVMWFVLLVCYLGGMASPYLGRAHRLGADAMAQVRYLDAGTLDADAEVFIWSAETDAKALLFRLYHVEQVKETGAPGYGETLCDSTYFRLWTQGLAKELTQELRLGFYECYYDWDEPLPPAEPGPLDEFYWNGTVGDQQFAVARLENRVVCVDYRGGADLREHTAYFAEVLAE